MTTLLKIFGAELVRVQLPMEAGPVDQEWSVPEPDLAVLAEAKPDFSQRHPNSQELTLLVEVSDTTVRHDATKKRDLYARAGVPEYWVLDLSGCRLIVHSGLNEEKSQSQLSGSRMGYHRVPYGPIGFHFRFRASAMSDDLIPSGQYV
jgi:Uma2 family endonuclease